MFCPCRLLEVLRDFGRSDWQLASMVCQTLWNYSSKITSSNACFGEAEVSGLTDVLIEYLGEILKSVGRSDRFHNAVGCDTFHSFAVFNILVLISIAAFCHRRGGGARRFAQSGPRWGDARVRARNMGSGILPRCQPTSPPDRVTYITFWTFGWTVLIDQCGTVFQTSFCTVHPLIVSFTYVCASLIFSVSFLVFSGSSWTDELCVYFVATKAMCFSSIRT